MSSQAAPSSQISITTPGIHVVLSAPPVFNRDAGTDLVHTITVVNNGPAVPLLTLRHLTTTNLLLTGNSPGPTCRRLDTVDQGGDRSDVECTLQNLPANSSAVFTLSFRAQMPTPTRPDWGLKTACGQTFVAQAMGATPATGYETPSQRSEIFYTTVLCAAASSQPSSFSSAVAVIPSSASSRRSSSSASTLPVTNLTGDAVRYTFTPPASVTAGGTMTLRFRFTQVRPAIDGPGVIVRFPDYVSVQQKTLTVTPPHADASKNTCITSPDPATTTSCFFHPLSTSQTATLDVVLRVDPFARCGQSITMTIPTIRMSPEQGVEPPNRQITVVVPVVCTGNEPLGADLETTLAAPASSGPGERATYTATLRNLGPGNATNTRMTILGPFMSYSNGTTFRGAIQPINNPQCTFVPRVTQGVGIAVDHYVCDFGTLPAGQTRQITYDVIFPANVPCGVDFYASVSTIAREYDPVPGNALINAQRTLMSNCRQPVLFETIPPPGPVAPGDTFALAFRFTQPAASTSPDGPGISVNVSQTPLQFVDDTFVVSPNPGAQCFRSPSLPLGVRDCFFSFLSSNQVATYTVRYRVPPTAPCGQTISIIYNAILMSPLAGNPSPEYQYTVPITVACPAACTSDADCNAAPNCGNCQAVGSTCQQICLQKKCNSGICGQEQYEWNLCDESLCQ